MKSKSQKSLYGDKAYNKFKGMYFRSQFLFLFFNISSILFVSILIILNLFAIRWNTDCIYVSTKKLFIALSIMNSLSGVVASIIVFLKLKSNIKNINASLIRIKRIKRDYINGKNDFANSRYKNAKLIELINNAINDAW